MLDLRRICWILPNYVFRSPRCQTFLWQLFQPCSWSKSSNFAFTAFPAYYHFSEISTFMAYIFWWFRASPLLWKIATFWIFWGHCRNMLAWQCNDAKKYVVTLDPCSKKISSGLSLILEIEIRSLRVVFNLITSKMEFGLWWGQILWRTEQKMIPVSK